MSEPAAPPMRVLFCIGVNQNFFDLPTGTGGQVWTGVNTFLTELGKLPGLRPLGTIDDDQTMVGPSAAWPWTCYVLAEADAYPTVTEACNLLRTVQVGEHGLWRYLRIEARVGRPLPEPWADDRPAEAAGRPIEEAGA
ncbi:hypothetical protein ABT381_19785 [Streptomyces sp. NPDC000151]|uniref:hypothetical protein n=1 Tax=Streptomyces sp. NPDC000151 TaxID=3154244 RepID=UPI003317BB1A